MAVTRCTVQTSTAIDPNATISLTTSAENAVRARSDLVAWFDAATGRGVSAGGGGLVTSFWSRKTSIGGEQIIAPSPSNDAPKWVATTDGQKGILCGYTSLGGSLISGDANRALGGNALALLPGNGSGAVAGTFTLSGGAISGGTIPVAAAGTLYTVAPVPVFGGVGAGVAPTAHCTISAGGVASIVVDTAGSGLTSGLTCTIVSQPAPFIVAMLAQQDSTSQAAIWSAGDTTGACGGRFENGGGVRFYGNIVSGSPFISTASVINNGALHLWEWRWDGSTATIYKDGASVLSGALAIAGLKSRILNFGGSPKSSGGWINGMDGYWEFADVFSGTDYAGVHAVVKADALRRHPSMTIA